MFDDDFRALTDETGMIDLADRSRIEVKGDDRVSFLHKLSTNEVNLLPAGGGCEAFFLDARGHVLGHAFLIQARDSMIIETVAGQSEFLLKHLDRYLIREKVELHDRTHDWGELLVAGAKTEAALAEIVAGELPTARLASVDLEIAGRQALAVRVDLTLPRGYLLFFEDRDSHRAMTEALAAKGVRLCDRAAFEAARIEAGFPFYGQDITDKNLPQEIDRSELAISFNKGCYLGQETVARIDALGHVNKTLVRLQFEGHGTPPPGTELVAGEVEVGQVTSAAFSPRAKAAVALAYVRRGSNHPGHKLSSAFGPAVILPK
ncbi:MAG TPA: glycine cleavage T C-terminal barrel domain-containing protein [Pirellulales bacterium]|nr:glycine cleavage T C-terminal barrel domain-containing protein [Pirellulales bacterium]